jgi:integrase
MSIQMTQQVCGKSVIANFTGHALRATAATLLANEGAQTLQLKRAFSWKSDSIAEGYVRDSKRFRTEVAEMLFPEDATEVKKGNGLGTGGIQFVNCVFNCPININSEK